MESREFVERYTRYMEAQEELIRAGYMERKLDEEGKILLRPTPAGEKYLESIEGKSD